MLGVSVATGSKFVCLCLELLEILRFRDLIDGLRDLAVINDNRQLRNVLAQLALTFENLPTHPPEGPGELADLVFTRSGRVEGCGIEAAIRE